MWFKVLDSVLKHVERFETQHEEEKIWHDSMTAGCICMEVIRKEKDQIYKEWDMIHYEKGRND